MGAFENLDQALRWLRNRQNRKQYEIAEAAGITKAMLSAYETGKQNPSIETLEKILEALHVDVAELHRALELHRDPESRTDLAAEGAPIPWTHDGGLLEPRVNLYRVLGIEHQLPADQERAFVQTLAGFHALLRALYDEHRRKLRASKIPLGPRRIEDVSGEDETAGEDEDES